MHRICTNRRKRILEGLTTLSAKRILDIGGASGSTSACLKTLFNVIYSVDLHKPRKMTKGILFRHGDIRHIPFPNNHFDLVISQAVLHHVPNDVSKALKEIYRVTKKGGVVFFAEPIRHNPFTWLIRHYCSYCDKTERALPFWMFTQMVLLCFNRRYYKQIQWNSCIIEPETIFSYPMPFLIHNICCCKPLLRKIGMLLYVFDAWLLEKPFWWRFCGYATIVVAK